MRGLLVRVAADLSKGGGCWNGPVDSKTGQFVYVAIPENAPTYPGFNKPYSGLRLPLSGLGVQLPKHLSELDMHLDPDFDHLTYGDQGGRARQISAKVGKGDLLVFYAGLRDLVTPGGLVYAIIGVYVIEELANTTSIPRECWDENAHTRRVLSGSSMDIVVRARPEVSGRLKRCIPIGGYRENAYRVWPSLLEKWGGLNVANGYIQRSARLPEYHKADVFYSWFRSQGVAFLPRNN